MYMHIYIYTKMFKISINCFSILLCVWYPLGLGGSLSGCLPAQQTLGSSPQYHWTASREKNATNKFHWAILTCYSNSVHFSVYLGERIVPRHREVEHSQCGRLQGELWFSDCFFGHDSSAWPGFNETDIRQPLGLLIHERCKVKFFPGVVFGSYLWLQFLGGRGRQIDLLGFEVSVVYMANSRAGRDT